MRGLLRLLARCCVLCLAVAAQAAPAAPIEIAPETQVLPVWQALRIVAPADRTLAPQQAAELAAGADAMVVDSPDRVLGRAAFPYWALFSLYNPDASEQLRLLAMEATTQFDTRLYERKGGAGAWSQVGSVALFLCMLAADLVGALWLSGFLGALFPAAPESTLSPLGFAAYAILFGCGSLHTRIYLNTATWAPRADRLLQALGWLWLALAPWFALTFPIGARILLVWGGTAIALILVAVSAAATRRRVPLSGFIAAAWLTYLLVGSYFLLARVVDNPLLWSSSAIALTQATLVAMLFGFAMIQRMLRQRDTLVAARQEAVMQREKGAALMRERSLLFAATNHDLRQPLLGVGVFAHLLKSAATPAEWDEHARKQAGDSVATKADIPAIHHVAKNRQTLL